MKGNLPIGASVSMRLAPSSLSVTIPDRSPESAAVISMDCTMIDPRRLKDLARRDLHSNEITLSLYRSNDSLIKSQNEPSRVQYLDSLHDPDLQFSQPQSICISYVMNQAAFDRLLGLVQAGFEAESFLLEVEGKCLSFDDSPFGDGYVWNLGISKHLSIRSLSAEGLRRRSIPQDTMNRMDEVMDMMLSNDFIHPDHIMGSSRSVIQTINIAAEKITTGRRPPAFSSGAVWSPGLL